MFYIILSLALFDGCCLWRRRDSLSACLISQRTIFILLELLRDADSKVRNEAILTARKVKRSETWPVMIDLLSSPLYSNQVTAALKEAGTAVLPVLDSAFYRSGQTDQVYQKCIGPFNVESTLWNSRVSRFSFRPFTRGRRICSNIYSLVR